MTVALFAVGVNAADPVLVITAEQIASSENNCSAAVIAIAAAACVALAGVVIAKKVK